jgi:hypothetical protein
LPQDPQKLLATMGAFERASCESLSPGGNLRQSRPLASFATTDILLGIYLYCQLNIEINELSVAVPRNAPDNGLPEQS